MPTVTIPYDTFQVVTRSQNKDNLALFKEELFTLSEETINNHIYYADLYINKFLIAKEMKHEEGVHHIDAFFSKYFYDYVPKPNLTKLNHMMSSVRQYYHCMKKYKRITVEEYKLVKETIENRKYDWCLICQDFKRSREAEMYGFFR